MTRFLFGGLLWSAIEREAESARRTKAAIAYVTKELPLRFKAGDVLITDATDGAIASGRTSASVLGRLHRKKVLMYSHPGLHAKLVIFDSMLFASSANLSDSSTDGLLEAGIQTDSPNSVSEAAALVERLISNSDLINSAFIKRIKRIPVKQGFKGSTSSIAKLSKRRRPLTWLIGVHDIEQPSDPAEIRRVEKGTAKAETRVSDNRSGTAWIRMPTRFGERIRDGDSLVLIDREQESSNPQRVFRHTAILLVQQEPKCARIFYEDQPYSGRRALTWSQFKKVAKLARIPGKLSKDTTRQVSQKVSDDLNDYWSEGRKG